MERRQEEPKKTNGLKRALTIATLIAVVLGIISVYGGGYVKSVILAPVQLKLAESEKRIDNLESAGASLKNEQVEMLARIRNTELNIYAIAVKLEVENIIKPVDK